MLSLEDIPEDVVLGIRERKANLSKLERSLDEEREIIDAEYHKTIEEIKMARHPADFPQKFFVPLCFCIESYFNVWLDFLGGDREQFGDLKEEEGIWREKVWKLRELYKDGEQSLTDYIDAYLQKTDPEYLKLARALELIKSFNDLAEVCYKIATDTACNMIGFYKKGEVEQIMRRDAEMTRKALADCKKELGPIERDLFHMSDNKIIAPYSQTYSRLYNQLAGSEIDSNLLDEYRYQLDVVLNVLRQMSNATRRPDDLKNVISQKINAIERLCLEGQR